MCFRYSVVPFPSVLLPWFSFLFVFPISTVVLLLRLVLFAPGRWFQGIGDAVSFLVLCVS